MIEVLHGKQLIEWLRAFYYMARWSQLRGVAMKERELSALCVTAVICLFSLASANAEEATPHHRITAQEVAEALVDARAITLRKMNSGRNGIWVQ